MLFFNFAGNDNIYALTNQQLYTASFVLLSGKYRETAAANCDNFWIDDENRNYTLHIAGCTGTAGDFMSLHNNKKFSTKDQENYEQEHKSCAADHKGAWWSDDCYVTNLNTLSARDKLKTPDDRVNWRSWRDFTDSLKATEIKIRPDGYEMPKPSWDDVNQG